MADINIPTGPIDWEPFDAIRAADNEPLDAAERQAIRQALHGIELGVYDHQIINWLCTWEPSTVAVICSWISRARAHGGDH